MSTEEYDDYAKELMALIAENEMKQNEVNMERLAYVVEHGGTEEARMESWEMWWPKIKPFIDKIKSLKEELKHASYMALDIKYMNQRLHSDVNPYKVIEERTEKLWILQRMKAIETEESRERRQKSFAHGGFLGHFDNSVQEWEIEEDIDEEIVAVRKHADGRWYDSYGILYEPSKEPYKYYDFNF